MPNQEIPSKCAKVNENYAIIHYFFLSLGRPYNSEWIRTHSRCISFVPNFIKVIGSIFIYSSSASLLAVSVVDKVNHSAKNDNLARCLYLVGFGRVRPRDRIVIPYGSTIFQQTCSADDNQTNQPKGEKKKKNWENVIAYMHPQKSYTLIMWCVLCASRVCHDFGILFLVLELMNICFFFCIIILRRSKLPIRLTCTSLLKDTRGPLQLSFDCGRGCMVFGWLLGSIAWHELSPIVFQLIYTYNLSTVTM